MGARLRQNRRDSLLSKKPQCFAAALVSAGQSIPAMGLAPREASASPSSAPNLRSADSPGSTRSEIPCRPSDSILGTARAARSFPHPIAIAAAFSAPTLAHPDSMSPQNEETRTGPFLRRLTSGPVLGSRTSRTRCRQKFRLCCDARKARGLPALPETT